ncbi:MAG TPA: hypothetical protein VFA80_17050 [Xanthobacteraceae bacterium]|nr:hypothetical protein [Xanthobacteraceae bacterium]
MIAKIFGAAFLMILGGLGGYVLASNPQLSAYLHWQQPIAQPTEMQSRIDPEMKYRLQERCADRAKKFYEEEYEQLEEEANKSRKTGDPILHTVYLNHYNEHLNKCFIFAQTKVLLSHDPRDANKYMFTVQDVNTRQQYAYYSGYDISQCKVRGSSCNSELEWWQLVKPYIEELASF